MRPRDLLPTNAIGHGAMALRLGKLFGNSASFWLNLQQAYDLKTLEVKMADELAAIPTLHAA